jgi:hypothetical protein
LSVPFPNPPAPPVVMQPERGLEGGGGAGAVA